MMDQSQIVLNVTQEDIDKAKPKDSSHCMIADALKRAVPTASRVSVDLATVRYSDAKNGKRYIFLTPQLAQQRLLWFDQADPHLKPFKVRLSRPVQIVKTKEARRTGRKVQGVPEGRAKLVKTGGGGAVPEKRGGTAPPLGALARGSGAAAANAAAARRRTAAATTKREERVLVSSGRIRSYGLRRMGIA
jgi:hypothetical protein